jgi:thiol:disulfide interchange protein DsbC
MKTLFDTAARLALRVTVTAMLLLNATVSLAEAAADQAVADRIRSSLAVFAPNVQPDSITATPVPGLYEVMFGPRLIYMSSDGRYLMQGNLIDLEGREDLTEPRVAAAKMRAVEAIGEDKMLTFGAADAPHTITVFTDIDCGYCRKLHSEMDQLNHDGIRVRYLLYPRAGKDSPSYVEAVSAWCADDPLTALTLAKKGQAIPEKTCDHPVDEHLALGHMMGIQGTPSILLDGGETLPGYVPAKRLKAMLEERRALATP